LKVQRRQTRARDIQSRTPTVYQYQTRAINSQFRTCSQTLSVPNKRYKYSIFVRHFRTLFPKYLPMTARGRHPTSKRFCSGFFQDGRTMTRDMALKPPVEESRQSITGRMRPPIWRDSTFVVQALARVDNRLSVIENTIRDLTEFLRNRDTPKHVRMSNRSIASDLGIETGSERPRWDNRR
jgi:hypothetical protein